jgi:vacuolar protein sorting-associated protein 29
MHIPHRAADLPKQFKALLQPGKIQHIICTGNVVDKLTFDYLRSLASDVHVVRVSSARARAIWHHQRPPTLQVRGDFDEGTFMPGVADSLPETKVVQIGAFKLGVCHGHQMVPWGDAQALGAMQRQLDCDILVTGHTHSFQTHESDGKLFINPGSATGAFSPSFKCAERTSWP